MFRVKGKTYVDAPPALVPRVRVGCSTTLGCCCAGSSNLYSASTRTIIWTISANHACAQLELRVRDSLLRAGRCADQTHQN